MRYLFDHWERIAKKLERADRLLLLFDYDGTLTPIVRRPQQARLDGRTKKWLGCVTRLPRVTVGIISGRAIADVSQLVSVWNVYYAGNHGLEILAGERRFVHPIALRAKSTLRTIAGRLKRALRDVAGATIDDKEFTLSVHYRLVERGQIRLVKQRFMEILRPFLSSSSVEVTRGKKVLEVRPNVGWNKGDAVGWLMKTFGKRTPFPVFVGDDATDEDAFRRLRSCGLTVRVGKSSSSRAHYYVKGTEDVCDLLQSIYELRRNSAR
ncbi:MAG: trehalose-phosphatase [Bacteroidota bacterium]